MANQKFSVNLEGFELNRAQVSALNKEINALVGKHLKRAVKPNDPLGSKIIKDPNWLGIWLRKFGTIGNLKESKTFKQVKLR